MQIDDSEQLTGHSLVGREINLLWEDKQRYDAVVVRYFPRENEYKLVYTADEGVEVANIDDREWVLKKKRISTNENPVLTGAIIEFVYPLDKKRYQAMVYGHSDDCEQLKVCYLDDHTTDCIGGRGWDFITDSPCALGVDGSQPTPIVQGVGDADEDEPDDDVNDDDVDDDDVNDDDANDDDYAAQSGTVEPGDDDTIGPVQQQSRVARAAASVVRASRSTAASASSGTRQGRVSKRKPWLK